LPGLSFGEILAPRPPRAMAFEDRLAATMAFDGIYELEPQFWMRFLLL
tara:strand:- start:110 stop:253 length:144 start_codon:yes stop_codon:yes gene_type:complete